MNNNDRGESMGSSWESIVVAVGIILLFYFARHYTPRLKSPKNMKIKSRSKEHHKPLEVQTKKESKQSRTKQSTPSNAAASLVMHPHSFERAKKEYLQNAQRFSGFYEVLYLSSTGKLAGTSQEQLLKSWEDGILSTDASNFILAWNTVIQKYCGRNFYFKGNSKGKGDDEEENRILQDWYRILHKWGLHREPGGQIQSELHGGEPMGAQELSYYWVLNGEILEEGRGKVQSSGQ